ncbi:MAG: hypothetical protein ACE5OZ_23285 [Candidatus Heimdallarchaeota archaeon]
MNTNDIAKEALELVGMDELPPDSAIYVSGDNIHNILYGIDIGAAELLYAKENDFDCVIAHHPVGCVDAWRIFLWHIPQLESKGVSSEEAKEIVWRKANSMKFGFRRVLNVQNDIFHQVIKLAFERRTHRKKRTQVPYTIFKGGMAAPHQTARRIRLHNLFKAHSARPGCCRTKPFTST